MANEATNIMASSSIHSAAIKVAKLLAADEQFMEHVGEYCDASDVLKRGPAVVYFDLLRIIGKDVLNSWPVPDTTATVEMPDGRKVHNNNPDKYTKDDGHGNTMNGSFYGDAWDATPDGAECKSMLDNVSKALKNDPTAPDDLRPLSSEQLQAIKKKWQNRQTNGRKALKYGAKVFQKFAEVEEKLDADLVKIGWIKIRQKDKTEVVTTSPACISIREVTSEGVARMKAITVTQFLGLNLDLAVSKGGTYEEVITSNKKGRKEADDSSYTIPANVDQFEDMVSTLGHFLEDTDHIALVWKALEKKGETKDELVKAIGDTFVELSPIWEKIKTRYNQLKDTGDDSEDTKVA